MVNKTSQIAGQSVLHEIALATSARLIEEKKQRPLDDIKRQLERSQTIKLGFRDVFLTEVATYPVIAEIKKASPSKGDIAPDLEPVAVAKDYVKNGAVALSVLTEPQYFKGSLDYLRQIRESCPETPLLMKDFFIDEYQLYQAKEAGADAILIIVALLGREGSQNLLDKACELGLTALVEVHNESELVIAKDIGADLIGINSRNLKTLDISLDNILRLIPFVPTNAVVIGESGIKTKADLRELKAAGCHGFLIGTHLMATGQPGRALADLIGSD